MPMLMGSIYLLQGTIGLSGFVAVFALFKARHHQ
jgi:hypothetical protein